MQERLGSTGRADRFYDEQMLDHLNARMREFVERQEMFFLATADGDGECDSSFRAGPPGFLQVLDEYTLAYPEYRGNGVHASLGNIQENPRLGILMVDFVRARIGLHVNGRAEIVEDAEIRAEHPHLPDDPVPGRRPELWVRVTVEEAYIHCAKHIPHLQYAPKRPAREWGTDDYKRKGGDFFGAARDRAAREHRNDHPSAAPSSVAPSSAGAAPVGAAPSRPRAVVPTRARPTAPASPAPTGGAASEGVPSAGVASATGGPRPSDVGLFGPAPDGGVAAPAPEPAVAVPGRAVPGLSVLAEASPEAWRQEAQRVVEEAEARGRMAGAASFDGWFG
ncbi:pyridoxamine 5'-phosphate oxidase family protein [Streptomyces sp. 549]|nr:pyridoxamine 5'-phosphate oxidase family protein [Streptomyces sp. 549]MDK1475026.1 pyridoxamine 5'-phosphate oxidase family protein [Streptomyces sp. 549]